MHYRNGREAKNGDPVVQLNESKIVACGTLIEAIPGNDLCNGSIVTKHPWNNGMAFMSGATICDCLHVDDLAAILAEKGLDVRPPGSLVST